MPSLVHSTAKTKQYLYSLLAVLLVSGACYGLPGFIGYRVVALMLLLTVSMLAVIFDILPVLFAASLSALIWDLFFIPPKFTIHVDTPEDAILLLMYFVIALINGVLTYQVRQAEKAARLKEEKANSVTLYNTILNSLSHELRTPIATIIGATDNLQTNHLLDGEQKEILLSEISRAALRLNQQVENLLNISRLESGHIQPKKDWCDVEELVYEVVKRVEENNPRRKIGISVAPSLPLCFLDKGMLDQVLYNLVNNAAIHTSVESRIDITVSCHADLLEIIIEDTGSGFTEEERKNVFDKFSREKKTTVKGSGLGLSIAKGFTDALGGTIELTPGMAGGARFTITLAVKISSP